MPNFKEQIEAKALEILRSNPNGVRYSVLLKEIKQSLPTANFNHIRGTIYNLDAKKPSEVYKPGRGIFRHTSFRENQTITEENVHVPVGSVRESDFYEPFADFLINDLGDCTNAIPLGGRVFEDKWGTPDVIGIEKSKLNDIIKHEEVIVSAEIKIDTQGLITAFGQACAYGSFSHKIYIVIPSSSDTEDKEKLESLCQIFGIGLILFDSTNVQDPKWVVRVRPIRRHPEMFYVNKYLKKVPEKLFS